jgi:hypothetical protein
VPVEAEDAGAFLRVSDYIHLNPARAGLPPARRPELRKTWALHNTLYE